MRKTKKGAFTVKKAAKVLGITQSIVYEYIENGKLSTIKKGGQTLIPIEDIKKISIPIKKERRERIIKTILIGTIATIIGSIVAAIFIELLVGPYIKLIGPHRKIVNHGVTFNKEDVITYTMGPDFIVQDQKIIKNADNTFIIKQLIKISLEFKNYSPIPGYIDKVEIIAKNLPKHCQFTEIPLYIDKHKLFWFIKEKRDIVIEFSFIFTPGFFPDIIKYLWYFRDNKGNIINPEGLNTSSSIISLDFREKK